MRSEFPLLLTLCVSTTAFGCHCRKAPQIPIESPLLQFKEFNTNPSDRELSGEGADSEGAQGIAFDGSHWFYANTETIYRLSGDFKDSDRSYKVSDHDFGEVDCDHVGGIDFYGGELYVAIDECSDEKTRVAVFDSNLTFKRGAELQDAELQDLKSLPWVAVNPLDGRLYTVSPDKKQLYAFPRSFTDGASISFVKAVHFQHHPPLDNFWTQGGAFSGNGLFFRVVDDEKDEDSNHTGIWVYELDYPIQDDAKARRVGFINIQYDPDQWALRCGFRQCLRRYELEDLDISSVSHGFPTGDVHIMMLSNEADEDDVSVFHFSSGDYDGDGVRDVHDNCVWDHNPDQEDLDRNRVGDACDNPIIVSPSL